MARIEKTVFISYRRKDISWALAVYQYLTSRKYDVFFDYTSIPSGDFEQIIVSNIRARAHFILVLTPTALDRCSEPGDWLRREIETAIEEKRNIIPLLLDGFRFGAPGIAEKLTGKLSTLGRYNGLDIPSGYFIEAMERLSERYLDVPLDAVIHPVSTEVRKMVKEEQLAVNEAVAQKWDDIKRLVRPVEEKPSGTREAPAETEMESTPAPGLRPEDGIQRARLRMYGIAAGFLLAVAIGILGFNYLQNGASPSVSTPAFDGIPITSNTKTPTDLPISALSTASGDVISTDTAQAEESTPIAASSPTLEPGSTISSEADGMTLHYVPAGEFLMGSDEIALSKPAHRIFLDAYWIDQTEVTNGMYAKCVDSGTCQEPVDRSSTTRSSYYGNPEYDNHPVIYVDWFMAKAYCQWADRRLLTEAEWEKAARGEDGWIYPWGNEQPRSDWVNYDKSVGDTTEVGSYPDGASPYGALDMAGNVWEWVADWYKEGYYNESPSSNPMGPPSGGERGLRGGSWFYGGDSLHSAYRHAFKPDGALSGIGFRCAVSE